MCLRSVGVSLCKGLEFFDELPVLTQSTQRQVSGLQPVGRTRAAEFLPYWTSP
jgi:hypothetical protein